MAAVPAKTELSPEVQKQMITCALAVGKTIHALNEISRAISVGMTQPMSIGVAASTSLSLGDAIGRIDESLDRIEKYCGLDVKGLKLLLERIDKEAGALYWGDVLRLTSHMKLGLLSDLRKISEVS
jgi:hypothetical protein